MIGEVGLVLMVATVGWFMRYLPEEAPALPPASSPEDAPVEKTAEAAPGAGGDGGPGLTGEAIPELAVKVEGVGNEQFLGSKAQRHRSHEGYGGDGARERGGRRRQGGGHRRR